MTPGSTPGMTPVMIPVMLPGMFQNIHLFYNDLKYLTGQISVAGTQNADEPMVLHASDHLISIHENQNVDSSVVL